MTGSGLAGPPPPPPVNMQTTPPPYRPGIPGNVMDIRAFVTDLDVVKATGSCAKPPLPSKFWLAAVFVMATVFVHV